MLPTIALIVLILLVLSFVYSLFLKKNRSRQMKTLADKYKLTFKVNDGEAMPVSGNDARKFNLIQGLYQNRNIHIYDMYTRVYSNAAENVMKTIDSININGASQAEKITSVNNVLYPEVTIDKIEKLIQTGEIEKPTVELKIVDLNL